MDEPRKNFPDSVLQSVEKQIGYSERATIKDHEGKKYLRTIVDATNGTDRVQVDVYSVLVAFNVTCPATAHAIKKLLCAGIRGKGDVKADLQGEIEEANV